VNARVFLALVFLLLPAALAVSDIQAIDAAKPYAETGAEKILVLDYTLEYAASQYWLVYLTPMDQTEVKNVIIVVSDATGEIIEDRALLEALYFMDLKLSVINFLEDNKLSFAELQSVLGESETKVDTALKIFDSLNYQISQEEYNLNIGSLEDKLFAQKDEIVDALVFIEDSISLKQLFEQEHSQESLNDLFLHYNKTFSELEPLFSLVSSYQKIVDDRKSDVGKLVAGYNISYEEGNKIVDSLTNMRDVGIDSAFQRRVENVKRSVFLMNSKGEETVTNQVNGFLFRKSKKDALAEYERASTLVEEVLYLENYYADYGISLSELKKKWSEARVLLRNARSASDYEALLTKLTQVDSLASNAKEEYLRKSSGPTTSPRPQPAPIDLSWIIIIMVFGGIVYSIIFYYQKYKREHDEFGGEQL
jgi:hypothetical protein